MKASNKRQRRIRRIEDLIESGEYRVYLDGQLVDDPQGLDISMYSININYQKKLFVLLLLDKPTFSLNR